MDATARLVAIIILTSFATERVLASAGYLLDLADPTQRELRLRARRKLFLFTLGAIITATVVQLADIRILRLVTPNVSNLLDFLVTWLVVFAGADQVRTLLQGEGGGGGSAQAGKRSAAVRVEIDRDGNVLPPQPAE